MCENDGRKGVVIVGRNRCAMQAANYYAAKGRIVYMIEEDGRAADQREAVLPGCSKKRKMDEFEIGDNKHPDRIRFVTNSFLESIRKKDGGIGVRIRKKSGFTIDHEKCNGCNECIKVCPVHMINPNTDKPELRTAVDCDRETGIYSIVRETPICQTTCPVRLDIRGYLGHIADGKFEKALGLIKEKLPFPGIIGRICTHPCEDMCNRGMNDAPPLIRDLKRFVADYDLQNPEKVKTSHDHEVTTKYEKSLMSRTNVKEAFHIKVEPEKTGRAVAVIGAGPAGLTCAHDLTVLGHKVTVFERLPVAGGMFSTAIPEFRLPRKVVHAEVDAVAKLGIEIKTNTPLGEDFGLSDLFGQGYESVFIAIGAQKSAKLNIPGEDAQGVLYGLAFLRDLSLGRNISVRGKIAIIGGGNVAMDAARSALRLGASEVTIVYRRSREEMPASTEEIEAVLAEGIGFEYLVSPVEVLETGGKLSKVKCVRMELREIDKAGRKRPVPISGTEYEMELDMLIIAVGQLCDLSFIRETDLVQVTKWGTIEADPITQATGQEGVYAGGDCILGRPRTAIEAVAAGKNAAESINRFLKKEVKHESATTQIHHRL